jgi:hypothetical protein
MFFVIDTIPEDRFLLQRIDVFRTSCGIKKIFHSLLETGTISIEFGIGIHLNIITYITKVNGAQQSTNSLDTRIALGKNAHLTK